MPLGVSFPRAPQRNAFAWRAENVLTSFEGARRDIVLPATTCYLRDARRGCGAIFFAASRAATEGIEKAREPHLLARHGSSREVVFAHGLPRPFPKHFHAPDAIDRRRAIVSHQSD